MPTPSRNYHVVADDTDDYLERTTGKGKRDPINDSRTNEVRPLVAERARRRKQTRATYAARILHAVLSVGFGAAGLVGLVTTVGSYGYFQFLFPVAFWVPVCAAVVAILHTFVGLLAAWKKFTVARIVSSSCLIGLAAFGFAATVAALEIAGGTVPQALPHHWNDAVQHHGKAVCDFQSAFDCRGWNSVCNASGNFTPSTAPSTLNPTPTSTTPVEPQTTPSAPWPTTETPTAPDTWSPQTTAMPTLWPGVALVADETHRPSDSPASSSSGNGSASRGSASSAPSSSSGSGSSSSGSGDSPSSSPTHTPDVKPTHPPTDRPSNGSTAPTIFDCAVCTSPTSPVTCHGAFVADLHENRVAIACGLLGVAVVALAGLISVVVATCCTVDVGGPGTF